MSISQPTEITTAFPWEGCFSFTKLMQHIPLMKCFVRKCKSKKRSCIKLKLAALLLKESCAVIFELKQRQHLTSELKCLQVSEVVPDQCKLLNFNQF